jgi:hypothetical protein
LLFELGQRLLEGQDVPRLSAPVAGRRGGVSDMCLVRRPRYGRVPPLSVVRSDVQRSRACASANEMATSPQPKANTLDAAVWNIKFDGR